MKKTVKERRATAFLIIMLSLIVLFVSVVCIFVSSRNKKLEANNSLSKDTTESTANISATATEESSESEASTEASETEISETTETEKTTVANNINSFKTVAIDSKNPYLTLVNLGNRLPENYKPQNLTAVGGTSEKLDSEAATHFEEMRTAALSDGVKLTPYSGYSSYELQNQNYSNKKAYFKSMGYSEEEASKKTAEYILPAGASEHNLGYAFDLSPANESFKDTDEFKWLSLHAQDYGFILRYPEDKTDITKANYEPYHWRYVGIEDAKKIKASGKCLEEYIGG